MEPIFTYLSAHFLEALIIVLLGTLFFKEGIMGIFTRFSGTASATNQDKVNILKMAQDMDALKMHFNDETTYLLTDIQLKLGQQAEASQECKERQIEHMGRLEEIRDTLRDIQRNGVRIRR